MRPPPSGDVTELNKFLSMIGPIKSYIEIGSLYGWTFEYITRALNPEIAVAVDMVDYKYRKPDPQPILIDTISRLREDGFNAELIIGNSRDPGVISKANASGPFDLVYIDGDHDREAAAADFKNYPGRIVAFHDIANRNLGVSKFWNKVKLGRKYSEIMNNTDKGKLGIGVLWQTS